MGTGRSALGRSSIVGLLALAALLWGWTQLLRDRDGVQIERTMLGATPVTVFRPAQTAAAAPLVVIAHGFAGSQQLMQPLALTLARNGHIAVTFDFPGHGRSRLPMTGGLADQDASLKVLLDALAQVTAWAGRLAPPGSGYALLGHSMASDIVVRHAQAHPAAWATVALSLFAPSIGADTPMDSPRNLLVVDGALEPGVMHAEALRVIGRVAGAEAQQRRTYGRFADGSARRAVFARGVEHIAVLYSADTALEASAWLHQAQGRPVPGHAFVASYGPRLLAVLVGVMGLAWALAGALPRVVASPRLSGSAPDARASPRAWRWRTFWPLVVVPALATPLILWKLPSDLLPILLGDYLVLHFAVYGLLTMAGLWWRGGPGLMPARPGAMLAATVCVSVFGLLAVGIPADLFLFNLAPTPERLPVIGALAIGTLLWFCADEAMTRSRRAPAGAYFATKLSFLLSLLLAIALNPQKLFFLVLIVPAILLLFVFYGLLSRWVFARTGHPLPAALANALVFAWFMALTFPLVA